MKKLLALFVVLAATFSASAAFAGTADARTANYGQGISSVVGVGDVSSGNTAEISAQGGVSVAQRASAVSTTGATYVDQLLYTGACYIQNIIVSGPTAGDYAEIYDALTATGTPKFDPRIAANTSTVSINCGGAPFTTGIYVNLYDNEVLVQVVYDY